MPLSSASSRNDLLCRYRLAAIAFALVLSFLPAHLKRLLHTRGPLHYWAHLYLFAGLAAALMKTKQQRAGRLEGVLVAVVLGFGIEFAQAHLYWKFFEIPDFSADLCGIVCGTVIGHLRSLPVPHPPAQHPPFSRAQASP